MIPVRFPEANVLLAMGQEEYEPMAVCVHGQPQRTVCCFRLTPAELEEIARTRTLWMVQLTFGKPFQPIALSTQRPEDMPS